MGLILMGVLICGYMAAAAAAQSCEIVPQRDSDIIYNATESSFTVNLECLPSGLGVTWPDVNVEYIIMLNYICRDNHGNVVTGYIGKISTLYDKSIKANVNLTQSDLRSEGNCTVFGCHQSIYEGPDSRIFYNRNESCQYPVPSPSSVDISLTSTSSTTELPSMISEDPYTYTNNSPSPTSTEMPATSTKMPATSTEMPATSTEMPATSTEMPATSIKMPATSTEMPATSTEMAATSIEMPATSTEMPATSTEMPATSTEMMAATSIEMPATSTEIPATSTEMPATSTSTSSHITSTTFSRSSPSGSKSSDATIVVIVVVLAFFILAILLITGICYCNNRKKPKMNPRSMNLGIALHVDSEKIDPYYMPIEVDSLYISKCESMGSIFEYLTPDNMRGKQILADMPSQQSKESREEQVVSFMLQPPPLNHQECLDASKTKSQEFSESDSNTFIATGSTLQHLEFESDDSLLSVTLGDETIACSNRMFEQKLCRSYSDDSCSSQSVANLQTFDNGNQSCDSKMYYDQDELIVSNPDEDRDTEVYIGNRIILTFSSSQSHSNDGNENVIIIEPESETFSFERTQSLSEKLQSLAETNLTINPHHFDPL